MLQTTEEDADCLRKTSEELQVFWMGDVRRVQFDLQVLTFYLLVSLPLAINLDNIQIRRFIQADKKLVGLLSRADASQIVSELALHNVY